MGNGELAMTEELGEDFFGSNLAKHDPDVYAAIENEIKRQQDGIELIASENFTSKAVMSCLGSVLTNKYSEGLPGRRYYGGNEIIDKIERLCRDRALECFHFYEKISFCETISFFMKFSFSLSVRSIGIVC